MMTNPNFGPETDNIIRGNIEQRMILIRNEANLASPVSKCHIIV